MRGGGGGYGGSGRSGGAQGFSGDRGGYGGSDRSGVPRASVFFSNVPLFVGEADLRRHFEGVGHVVSFRMLGPSPGKEVRFGFVDYLDSGSAGEAIRRLNGFSFGERSIRVSYASSQHGGGESGFGHSRGFRGGFRPIPLQIGAGSDVGAERGYDDERLGQSGGLFRGAGAGGETYVQVGGARSSTGVSGASAGDLLQFPPEYVNPLFGRDDTMIESCLAGMPVAEAYEAVEQLRVLVLEQNGEARELLERNPQLRLAVVVILQHAGRLPYGPLPPLAFDSRGSRMTEGRGRIPEKGGALGSNLAPPLQTLESNTSLNPPIALSKASEQVPCKFPTTPAPVEGVPNTGEDPLSGEEAAERASVLEAIEQLSEEDVERILIMTDAQIHAIPDAVQQKQIAVLHRHLVQMAAGL